MSDLKISMSSDPFKGVDKTAKKARDRAIKRTLSFAQKQIVQTLKDTYTLKSGSIKESLSVHRDDDNAAIIIRGLPLGIDKYSFSPKSDTTGAARRPVKVSVTKGVTRTVENGFVWQNHVFRRMGNARTPIAKETGPSVPQLIDDPQILEQISDDTHEFFKKRFNHELDYALGKNNGNK